MGDDVCALLEKNVNNPELLNKQIHGVLKVAAEYPKFTTSQNMSKITNLVSKLVWRSFAPSPQSSQIDGTLDNVLFLLSKWTDVKDLQIVHAAVQQGRK